MDDREQRRARREEKKRWRGNYRITEGRKHNWEEKSRVVCKNRRRRKVYSSREDKEREGKD